MAQEEIFENDEMEELYHLQESTNSDGTVDVEITSWEKCSTDKDEVYIKFKKPNFETDAHYLPWPEKDSTEYAFVRLVNSLGFDLANADKITGEEVKYHPEREELVIPKGKIETLKKKITSFMASIRDLKYRRTFWLVVSLYVLSVITMLSYESVPEIIELAIFAVSAVFGAISFTAQLDMHNIRANRDGRDSGPYR